MPLANPLFLLTGFICVVLSPCLALFGLAIYKAAKDHPARDADARLIAKLRQVEAEKQDLLAQFDAAHVNANQMIDRIRLLERLLIEERRNRLAESTEILRLRERLRS